jgi:protein-S-isoprenylcysteine O-methyltransferase Ste14
VPFIIAIVLLSWPDERGKAFFTSIWPRSSQAFWIGFFVVLAGLGFSIWARRVLGRNWSAIVTVKQEHELIQTGPYRYIRHPIYTGILVGCIGSAIPASEWRGYGACLLVLLAFTIKLKIEEHWMTEYFGPLYAQYQKRTRMLIPFIW